MRTSDHPTARRRTFRSRPRRPFFIPAPLLSAAFLLILRAAAAHAAAEGSVPASAPPGDGVKRVFESVHIQDDTPGEFKVVLWADGPIREYRISYFKDPFRMVVDLPGDWERPRRARYRMGHDTVRRIRAARHPDKLRLVLELKTAETLAPYIQESLKGMILTLKKEHLYEPSLAVPDPRREKGPTRAVVRSRISGKKRLLETIEGRSMEDGGGGFELRIDLDGPPPRYKTFVVLDDPPAKVVLDLPGPWRYEGPTVEAVIHPLVERIRVGEHPGFLRIAVDLDVALSPTYGIEETGEGLRMTISGPPPAGGGIPPE